MFPALMSFSGLSLIFNSYSASSLNLLFFWMTWSTLVLSHTPLRVELIASLFVRLVFFFLPAILFTFFDALLPSLAEKEKADGKRTGNRAKDVMYSVGVSASNVAACLSIQALVEYATVDVVGWQRALRVTTSLPLPWEMTVGMIEAVAMREVLIYYPHRHLHKSKTLLADYHNHPTPTSSSLNLTSDSLVSYVLLNFFPTYLPAVILRFHILTYLLFLAITSFVDVLTYSNYESLPSMFMVGRIATRVRGHYEGGGKGGYGWLGFLDWVHATEVKRNAGGWMGVSGGGIKDAPRKGRSRSRKSK